MATPTVKSPDLEEFLNDVYGVNRKDSITSDQCVFCKKEATSFRNQISLKEFSISGMCQDCQDSVFGVD